MTTAPILILDFDGVICDTTEECLVAAWNAWLGYTGREGWVTAPEQLPAIAGEQLRTLRPYVRTAGEYLVLLQALEAGTAVKSQADFERCGERFGAALAGKAERFFAARARHRREAPRQWLALHRVYPGIAAALPPLLARFDAYMVTGKDGETVRILLEASDLTFPADRIFDREAGRDKLAHVRAIARRRHCPLDQVWMVDDNVIHLLPVQAAGAHVLLAGWGYHTPEHLALARRERVPVVSLEEWSDRLLAAVG